jgi:hypothetical protein
MAVYRISTYIDYSMRYRNSEGHRELFYLCGKAAAFLRLVYLTNTLSTVHCTKSKTTIILFPRLVYLANTCSPVHLPNVCLIFVIALSRVAWLATAGTDRYRLSKHVICLPVKHKLVGVQHASSQVNKHRWFVRLMSHLLITEHCLLFPTRCNFTSFVTCFPREVAGYPLQSFQLATSYFRFFKYSKLYGITWYLKLLRETNGTLR